MKRQKNKQSINTCYSYLQHLISLYASNYIIKMKKNKRIAKEPKGKEKNSSTLSEEQSSEQAPYDKLVKARNQQNAELTRIKDRVLTPFLKNIPYCTKRMVGQEWPTINTRAMKCGLIDFSETQQKILKKQTYYSLLNDIPQPIRANFVIFISNLLSYSQQQLFNKNASEIMEHKLKPQAQALIPKAEQLLKEVEQILVQHKVEEAFDVEAGICNMRDQSLTRVANKTPVNKLQVFFLLIIGAACIFSASETNTSQARILLQGFTQTSPFTLLTETPDSLNKPNEEHAISAIQKQVAGQTKNIRERPQFLTNITNSTEPSNLIFDSGAFSSNFAMILLVLFTTFSCICICALLLKPSVQKAKLFFKKKDMQNEVYV